MKINSVFYDSNPIEFFLKLPAYSYITSNGFAKTKDMTLNDIGLSKNYFLKKETEKRSNIKANPKFI
jgi:hypothetical protein